MKKYDNYKDSGIEWIGSYPKNWTLMTVRRITDDHKQGYYSSEEYKEEGYKLVRITDLDANGNINISKSPYVNPNNKEIQIFEIKKGDMLFPRTGSIGLIGVAREDMKAVFASYLIRFRFKANTYNSFMRYYFMSDVFLNGLFSDLHGGVNQNIHAENIKDQHIVLPSIVEQQSISYYLDHKTTQIDTLIVKKEQFISLLQEERTAVISQAVTKGLDPKVKMKDSGIEWLGEIPEHWELKRMKYLCDVTTGGKDTENREDDGKYPFFVRSQTIERISSYSFDGEAILTAGDGVGVCKVWHYVNEKFDFHQRVYMMSNFQPVLGKYLFYYLKENFGKEVMKLSAKSTVDSLRRPMFQNFMVCFGSLDEQKKIIEEIEFQEARIDTLISKSQQEIELLKEYKTALISEVITGQVDVRDVVLN
jgi:type I restriction enzyme, S subunit